MPQGVAPEARPKGAQLPPPQQVAASSSPADTPHDVNAPPTTAASPPAVKSTMGPPTGAASGTPLATQTPAVSPGNDERRAGLTTSPGESTPAAPKQIDVPMPLAVALKSPRLLSPQFLIEIDESAFRSSSSEDQRRLKKATADYRSMRTNEMMEDLAHARSADANVLFLRALGLMRQISSNRYSLARHLLQTAVSGGQAQAAVILGILLVSGPDGVDKDVSEGRKLIEVAAVAGGRMAQRGGGLGHINGGVGSAR